MTRASHSVHVDGREIMLEDCEDGTFTVLLMGERQQLWRREQKGWMTSGFCNASQVISELAFKLCVCGLKWEEKTGKFPWGELSANKEYRHFNSTFNWHCTKADGEDHPLVPPSREIINHLKNGDNIAKPT